MSEKILEVKNLTRTFRNGKQRIAAVEDLSFDVFQGEAYGLLGQSGSGKSTAAAMIAGFLQPDSGEILCRGRVQMVFQNPAGSLVPHMKVLDALIEGMRYQTKLSRKEMEKRAFEVLEQVGLDSSFANRLPGELSGGQCQRVAIGRAIMLPPALLICDEMTSALDVFVQAQIMKLVGNLQKELDMSVLFITHDVALAGSFCDRIGVMENGRMVEQGDRKEVLNHPKEAYTKLLINSVLTI